MFSKGSKQGLIISIMSPYKNPNFGFSGIMYDYVASRGIPFQNVFILSRNKQQNCRCYMSCLMIKSTYWHVHPAKTESLLCTHWVAKNPSFLQADSEASDQTGRMPRLIWVLARRTCHFVGFVTRQLICCCGKYLMQNPLNTTWPNAQISSVGTYIQ